MSNERLERVWARQHRLYEKIGNGFERDEEFTDRVQNLIDRAKENGKDVSAVQSTLDTFEAALKDAHPVYESGKGIVNSHQGFDENGKVNDPAKAKETVQAMGEKLKEIKDAMGGTGKALHEAIKAFREANPRVRRICQRLKVNDLENVILSEAKNLYSDYVRLFAIAQSDIVESLHKLPNGSTIASPKKSYA